MKTSDAQLVEAPVNSASVLLIDPTGVIVDAHDSTCAALGWIRDDLVSRPITELLEFGSEQLMERLPELQDTAPDSNFSVLTLVRRQDQRCVPTTAIVRLLPELGCYSISFDDLPGDEADANPQPSQPTPPPVAFVHPPAGPTQTAPVQSNPPPPPPAANPRFRNIFLNDEQRPTPKPPPPRPIPPPAPPKPEAVEPPPALAKVEPPAPALVPAPAAAPAQPQSNLSADFTAQHQTAEQEQRRLEERVLSLTDQLQQLHGQLKGNLESEAIAQKRLREREADAEKAEKAKTAAEEQKVAAETALAEQQKLRENLEQQLAQLKSTHEQQLAGLNSSHEAELAQLKTALAEQQKQRENLEVEAVQLKSTHAQQETDRAAKQQEWLAKLQTNTAALHESDQRLAAELETRRALQQTLQSLHHEFSSPAPTTA